MHTFNIVESDDFRTGRYTLIMDGTQITKSDSVKALAALAGRLMSVPHASQIRW